jgi:hypothetical protein
MGLGLRADVFGPLNRIYLAALVLFALIAVGGSMAFWAAWLLRRIGPEAVSRRSLAGGMLITHLALFAAGYYIGLARGTPDADSATGTLSSVRSVVRTRLSNDLYETQVSVTTLIGDTKVVHRPPYITMALAREARSRLKPGDIILERLDWKLSNPFLAGFWPHAALYIGTVGDLESLGIADDPRIQAKLSEFSGRDMDDEPFAVIEALGEGVVFRSLSRSLEADYAAVLRPRLPRAQIAEALARAFANHGKAYDFNFDFDDRQRLVCTQLVYLSYEGMLSIELVRIMGRNTLPALEFAKKYAMERDRTDRQLDFVLFLDAVPADGCARFATEEEFVRSIQRPRFLAEP